MQQQSERNDGLNVSDNNEDPSPIALAQNEYNADFMIISGHIGRDLAQKLVAALESRGEDGRPNVCLFLTSFGGDADAAYIIAKTIKRKYEHFSLFISSYCKSAGTLIALGANEIVMFPQGEIGPLDVQWVKEDTLGNLGSGLDISNAIESLSGQAFKIFETQFLEIMQRSGGAITTRTALQIASQNAIGLISPLTAQLDPLKIGEIHRALDIAYNYGVRLGANPYTLQRLIHRYPSHSFVIDYEEASDLLDDVRLPSDLDFAVESQIRVILIQHENSDCLANPPHDKSLLIVLEEEENDPEGEPDPTQETHNDTSPEDETDTQSSLAHDSNSTGAGSNHQKSSSDKGRQEEDATKRVSHENAFPPENSN